MNYYFITGTTGGIGEALSKLLMQEKNNFVFGLSRSNDISNLNFKFIKLDLLDLDAVKNFEFPELENPASISLINNAAHISEIVHLGKRKAENIIEAYNVNIVSPSILINSFLKKYQPTDCKKTILNVSSGAAKKPIEAWSTYCASKAALAMISEVTSIEQKLKYPFNPVNIFSIEPGVVDTRMQDELRKISADDFSEVGRFIEYKEKKQLSDPKDVAKKLYAILKHPDKFEKVSFSVKDF